MTSPTPKNPIGAHPLTPNDDHRKKRPLWLLLLAGIVLVAIVAVLLSRCSGDSKDAKGTAATVTSAAGSLGASVTDSASVSGSVDATSPSVAAPSATVSSPAAGGADGGSLTADGTTLLPASAGSNADLSGYAGKQAAAKDVLVLSAPADNGFWIGTSTADEVWVQLLLPGLVSPHPVRKGDRVSFPATVTANPAGFAASAGVSPAAGAARLTAQKAHLQVAKTAITFTS